MDPETTQCQPCPAGTVVRGVNAWGIDSCIRCGEGLTALRGTQCITSCHYSSTDGQQYDFTPLSGYVSLSGARALSRQSLKIFIHHIK